MHAIFHAITPSGCWPREIAPGIVDHDANDLHPNSRTLSAGSSESPRVIQTIAGVVGFERGIGGHGLVSFDEFDVEITEEVIGFSVS